MDGQSIADSDERVRRPYGGIAIRPHNGPLQEWMAFTSRCEAPLVLPHEAVWPESFAQTPYLRERRFDILSMPTARKVGQCAIRQGFGRRFFLEGIQILPTVEHRWGEIASALFAAVGAGRYIYGTRWTTEPERTAEMSRLRGLKIRSVRQMTVQAIDFPAWPSLDNYARSVGQNARRNARKAAAGGVVQLRERRGWRALLDVPSLTRLHVGMAHRKRLEVTSIRFVSVLLLCILSWRNRVVSATALVGDTAGAAFFGIDRGQSTVYLKGGSLGDRSGAAWLLLLEQIQRAFVRSDGKGRFLMGTLDDDATGGWEGLAFSRRQCRVSDFPTAIIRFDYVPPSG